MNEFPRKNKTDAGTVFGVLAVVFVGVPLIFCLACGFGAWAMLGFPGGGASSWGMGKKVAWQHVLDEKRRLHGELITEMNNMASSGQVSANDLQRLFSRADEVDRQVNKLVTDALAKHGRPPSDMEADLKANSELLQASANLRSARVSNSLAGSGSTPSGESFADRFAQQRAEAEQRAAQMRAEAEQREAERKARDQQFADQARARAEEFRNRVASSSPPPPVFNNVPPPIVPQQPAVEAPPGFPCTNLGQIKPKDLVFAQSADTKWYPAMVLVKKGTNITIQYTTNGYKEIVLINRIRLQTEGGENPGEPTPPPAIVAIPPVVPEVQRLPPGFRPVNPPKAVKTRDDEEAENLLVIKPKKEPDEPAPAPPKPGDITTPTPTPMPPTPTAVANYRTWTSSVGTTIEAELLGFEFDVVQLKRKDGKILSLQINQLSAADQAYLREKFK